MSKLSRKLLIAILAISVIMCACILAVTIGMSRSHNDALMSDRAETAIVVMKNDVEIHLQNLYTITFTSEFDDFKAAMENNFNEDGLNSSWNYIGSNSNFFAVCFDASGNLMWKSKNCGLNSVDVSAALNGNVTSGIMTDSQVELYMGYIFPVKSDEKIIGAVLIGEDFADSNILDSVKEQTNAEITVFSKNIRYATTVAGSDGKRAVGTPMAEKVAKQVIQNGKTYSGTADVLGQNHYVYYEPLYSFDQKQAGAYFTGFSSEESDSSFIKLTVYSVLSAVVILAAGCVVIVIMIGKMVDKPIVKAGEMVEAMSLGRLGGMESETKAIFSDDGIGLFVKRLDTTRQTLSNYINDVSSILSRMATGDFSYHSSMTYMGDFEKIHNSFDEIENHLRGIIENINISSTDVSANASSLANGTTALADGCVRQSTQIDKLSSVISDISIAADHSADNSYKANELSVKTSEKIEISDREMNDMLTAMNNIEEKSNQIGAIIKTIEDIAFQTNILALNAAVETARAGEAGKGFAVVADEVRSLAAKSAEAANGTTELISSTISAVTSGAEIARNTAASLKIVKDYSSQTAELINEIYSNSEKQANAAKEIKEGILEISEVVQQNSATSEQSAAACEELSTMAEMLKSQISKLKA